MAGQIVRVATVNLLRDASRWPERLALMVRELAELSLDLIAVQEVTDPLSTASSAHQLAEHLGGYSVFVCPKTGWGRQWEGIAVLSRLPVEDQEVLDLGSQQRVAQFVRVRVGEAEIVLVNGHYYWPVGAHSAQAKQAGRVLDRLQAIGATTAVVCGDFNATPQSRSVSLMRGTLASAYEAAHGREPEYTFPSPLIGGGRLGRRIRSALRSGFRILPSDVWRGTLDYIFVGPGLNVVECSVILDRPAPDDPTLYASDHFGIAATLEIRSPVDGVTRMPI